jgi:hypothetical protein
VGAAIASAPEAAAVSLLQAFFNPDYHLRFLRWVWDAGQVDEYPVVPSTTMPPVFQGGDGGDLLNVDGQEGKADAEEDEDDDDEGPMCSVCLEPYDRQDPPVHLKCSCGIPFSL